MEPEKESILVIPTNEEIGIAREIQHLINNKSDAE